MASTDQNTAIEPTLDEATLDDVRAEERIRQSSDKSGKQLEFKAEHFINRELSWLEFNKRVLEEAESDRTPLLERVKFLSIFSSNLDEFFMVRVAGLREQAFGAGAPQDANADGLRAVTQLERIAKRTRELVAAQYHCLNKDVLPSLSEHGLQIVRLDDVKDDRRLKTYFDETIFPILTPTAIDPSHPRPRYHNRAIYLAVMLRRSTGIGPKELFGVVQVPQVLPRLVPLEHTGEHQYVLLEDIIASRLPELFGGYEVEASATFRITRDSDISMIEQESDDMLRLIEERLKARRRADAVRLEISDESDDRFVQRIVEQEQLRGDISRQADGYSEVYRVAGPVDLTGLMSLLKIPDFENLRDPPFSPTLPRGLRRHGEDLFSAIRRRDILLHHPFDSFMPVVEFVRRAAEDPDVLAIKQTLYRTSGDSPITAALMQAAENGKQVTALVELQARFDEAANVGWARQLERAGVHVVYGFMDMKTHCKVSLVVRQEENAVRRYVHLGTGNYNPTTALLYTDLGLFTTDEDIATDVSGLFNLLTGYSQGHQWRKLVVAPQHLHRQTMELIEVQTKRARASEPSAIFAKLNSLVDSRVIASLYRASQAGVPIDLMVRGICCLRPGIPGISENIRVRSIVDRFLEHSRILVFGPEETAQVFLSSADWMPRNFYRRMEVMFPIESTPLKKRLLHEIIPIYLRDNTNARALVPDGSYERVERQEGEPRHRSQQEFLDLHQAKAATKSSLSSDEPPGDSPRDGKKEAASTGKSRASKTSTDVKDRALTSSANDKSTRRLIIMRHAKSSWESGASTDHERPLNERGRRDAPAVAQYMSQLDWHPDLVVCSDSKRTRETIELMLEHFNEDVEIRYSSTLYHAGVEGLIQVVSSVPDDVKSILVVAHNPGCEDTIQELCGEYKRMTTANVALLIGHGDSWSNALSNRKWELLDVVRPKSI